MSIENKVANFLVITSALNLIKGSISTENKGEIAELTKVIDELAIACSSNNPLNNSLVELKQAVKTGNSKTMETKLDLCVKATEQMFVTDILPHMELGKPISCENTIELIKFLEEASDEITEKKAAGFLYLGYYLRQDYPDISYIYLNKAFELNGNIDQNLLKKDYVYDEKEPQLIFENCLICGSEDAVPYYTSFAYTMASFSKPHQPAKLWVKCNNCGNLYTYAYPKALTQTSQEGKKISPNPENSQSITDIMTKLSIWSDILNKLSTLTTGKSVLEVGIGRGEFIAVALEMGYEIEAVEIVEDSCQTVADVLGVDIWCCDFLKFSTRKKYSIITMGDVLEHVTSPLLALKKAAAYLKKGGVLWLSTPNFKSSFSRLRKFEDPMWCEPWHLTYFSFEGLKPFIEQTGLEVVEYNVSGRYNGSMELILRKKEEV